MSQHAHRAAPAARGRRRTFAVLLATVAVTAAGLSVMPADAATTITPAEPGTVPVVRDDSITVKVDKAAQHFQRSSSTASYTPRSPSAVALNGCKGDNPAGTNASPRTIVTVTDPDGAVVLTATSPVRDLGLLSPTGLFANPSAQPLSPQPAPGNSNFRGDFPDANAYHGFSATLSLAGKPAGVYTVSTLDMNTVKTTNAFGGGGTCAFGTPSGSTVGPNVAAITSFEYRPWQVEFKDIFGKGNVNVNVDPRESRFSIGSKTSPITAGTPQSQWYYSLPSNSAFALPSDPVACASNPASCLPANATACDPADGCTPRLMVLYQPVASPKTYGIVGIFDLDTKAFIALAKVDGTSRVLASVGTQLDAIYGETLTKVVDAAAAQGIDLMRVLTTEVKLNMSGTSTSLSLLNGLQIDPTTLPNGIELTSGITKIDTTGILTGLAQLAPGVTPTVQAGLILHLAVTFGQESSCTAPYRVAQSDLLPDVPTPGALGTLVGGPIYSVSGKFNTANGESVSSAILGVDTAAGEPNGYPVWINPLISGINSAKASNIDFLGTLVGGAPLANIVTDLGSLGCLRVGSFLGTGVAILNNPFTVGLKDVFDPLTTPNPAVNELVDSIGTAADEVVDSVLTAPLVADLLGTIIAELPTAVPAP